MVTYGFYNSIGGDRRYSAVDMSSIFDGIINDGVFASVGDALVVSATTGMIVSVGTGRAWFNHTWTNSDTTMLLTVDPSGIGLSRIDAVIIEINSNTDVRANSIKIVKGTPSVSPVAPELLVTESIHQYPLCHISIAAGSTEIIAANITNKIGTSACPLVTGILETVNIDALLAQWNGKFNDWFETLEDILDENTAGNLLNLINDNTEAIGIVQEDLSIHSANDTRHITTQTQEIINRSNFRAKLYAYKNGGGGF